LREIPLQTSQGTGALKLLFFYVDNYFTICYTTPKEVFVVGKALDYITRGPEYRWTYKRSGTSTPETRAIKCKSCGKMVSVSNLECPECGFDLTSEEQLEQNNKERRANRIIILLLLLFGVAVCATTVYLLLHTQNIADIYRT